MHAGQLTLCDAHVHVHDIVHLTKVYNSIYTKLIHTHIHTPHTGDPLKHIHTMSDGVLLDGDPLQIATLNHQRAHTEGFQVEDLEGPDVSVEDRNALANVFIWSTTSQRYWIHIVLVLASVGML